MKNKSKLARRITWRVILIIVFFNVFIIGAVVAFDFAVSMLESEARAQYLLNGMTGKLETMRRAVEITAKNNVAAIEANLDSPEKVYEALEAELRVNNTCAGCFVAFEPDYFPSQGRWFAPSVSFQDSTQIVREQKGSAQYDYFKEEWYEEGLHLPDGLMGYMTDPYVVKEGSQPMLCTYVTPVCDASGRKVGLYGLIMYLGWLEDAIASEESKVKKALFFDDDVEDFYFFLQIVDGKGRRIAGYETVNDKIIKVLQEKNSEGEEMIDVEGTPYYVGYQRLDGSHWTLLVAQHYKVVFLWGIILAIVILFFMSVGGLVIFFFLRRSIRSAVQPLRFLSDSAQEVAKGNFDTALPSFKHKDEIAQLRDSFDSMQQSLKSYVKDLQETTAAKAAIMGELNVAHSIQMSMLPKTYPAFPERTDLELYGSLEPAKAVGGDLYDFFIRDEKLFFCIGDVSGKGVPASLVMAVSRTLFRNIAYHHDEPSRIADFMNAAISDGNDECMFVTLFVGVLDLPTGRLSYCNAGHNSPYLQHAMLPCDANLPIGVTPDLTYSEQQTVLEPGTMLFLYTDGLTEAENVRSEQFGEERVTQVIASHEGMPQELVQAMTNAVRQFAGDAEQSDDLTMLAIKYTNNHQSTSL